MDFRVAKEKLLRVLRSDISGTELRTGHGNPALLDASSDDTNSRPTSPESCDDILVHTHEDMLSSVTKQLEIQQQINTICERDLQYRTEIIELLSARITQLEGEALAWREKEKSFASLKEKMMYLETLYGGDGARELELGQPEVEESSKTIPEGHSVVDTTYLESLKGRISSYEVEIETWRLRISTLEASLADEQAKHSESSSRLDKLTKDHEELHRISDEETGLLKRKIEEFNILQSKANARNSELQELLNSANDRVKQLTVDLAVAEEMRNASLATVSNDAQEFAKLRGRIVELEGQLVVYEEDKAGLAERIEEDGIKLQESRDELENSKNILRERDNEVTSLRSHLSTLQTSMEDALAKSAANIEELQKKMNLDASESHSRVTALQQELEAVCNERDTVKESVSALELRVQEYEHELQQKISRISELDAHSSTLTERITTLDMELATCKRQLEDLRASSAANESALNQQLDDLRSKADEDTAEAARHRSELETQILVIKEECQLHSNELLQTKELLEEAEASKVELADVAQRTSVLENSLHDREARIKELTEELAGAKDAVKDHELRQAADADALEQLQNDHARAIAEYEGRLSEMTNGANANASRHAALENEVSSLTGRLSTLESELALVRDEKDAMQKAHEQELTSVKGDQEARFMNQDSEIKSLSDQLAASQETCTQLQGKLTEAERSMVEEKSHANEASSHSDASLDEARQKVASLEAQLEEKETALEEMGYELAKLTGLEDTLAALRKEKEEASAKASDEVERIHGQLNSVQSRLDESLQSQKELEALLKKANSEVSQRQTRIEMLEKEAKGYGGRSSIDESSLQDLYAEHERQISQMEQDYDELRMERDGLVEERDKGQDENERHLKQIAELEEQIHELEAKLSTGPASPSVASPTSFTSGDQSQQVLFDLENKLRESEARRRKAEQALLRRSHSGASGGSRGSRDSIIIVESVDEHGKTHIQEMKKINDDAGSDTASDVTADNSTLANSVSMASTTSSVAELEAAKARAEMAEHEVRRLSSLLQGKEKGKESLELPDKSKRLSRHDSRRSSYSNLSIASALSGASRMVGSIGHSEGMQLFPERSRKSSESRKSLDHSHHHEHEMSNPFMFFSRDRTDSMRSRRSVSVNLSSSTSEAGPSTPSRTNSNTNDPSSPASVSSPQKTAAMAERERKAKEKADRAEKERAEKAAKIEKEKAHKAEKAAKREKERLEREQKEKERKARLKADPNGLSHLTALRQGAGNYYETN